MKKSFVIALMSLTFLGQIACDNGKKEAEGRIENLNIDLENAEEAKATLQNELDNLKAEFDRLQSDVSNKDSLLSQKDTEIANKQKEIQSILSKKNATEAELRKAKDLISSLNADVNNYKNEIASLKSKNDSLQVANDTLKVNQGRLSENLEAQTKRADDTEALMKSTFSVSNYKIQGLLVRNSGKEVETDKAKRIDKIRVSFDIDPNQNADGQKEIYIAIYKPDGSLGKFKGANPGQIKTNSNGTIDYSDKVSFNYQRGSKQNISFDWEDYDFPKGLYKIDLYQNGMKIGQKSLDLK